MAKMGRPLKEIDKSNFEKLCGIFCTKREICSFFDVSEDTVERWCKKTYGITFAAIYEQKKDSGKISLRRSMFQNATNGNTTMQIWLSKQWLGMTDKTEEVSKQEIKTQVDYKCTFGGTDLADS